MQHFCYLQALISKANKGDSMSGEDYEKEYFDPEIQSWTSIPYKSENVGFEDIAYVMNQGKNEYSYDSDSWWGN